MSSKSLGSSRSQQKIELYRKNRFDKKSFYKMYVMAMLTETQLVKSKLYFLLLLQMYHTILVKLIKFIFLYL